MTEAVNLNSIFKSMSKNYLKPAPTNEEFKIRIQKRIDEFKKCNPDVTICMPEYKYYWEKNVCTIVFSLYAERDEYEDVTVTETLEYDFQDPSYILDKCIDKVMEYVYKVRGDMRWTQDLSLLMPSELKKVAELLTKYAEYMDKGGKMPRHIDLRPQFNCIMQKAFLVESGESEDQCYRCWGINSKGEFEKWFTCGECGKEGFLSEIEEELDECCKEDLEYFKTQED